MGSDTDPGSTSVRELAAAAIQLGGAEGIRRVSNLLAALRDLKAKGQLPKACEADLRSLEDAEIMR